MEKLGNLIIGGKCLKVKYIKYVKECERVVKRGKQINDIKVIKVLVLGIGEYVLLLDVRQSREFVQEMIEGF